MPDAAKLLGISRQWLWVKYLKGEINAQKIGRFYAVIQDEKFSALLAKKTLTNSTTNTGVTNE